MLVNNNLIIKNSPDFEFILVENTANRPDLLVANYNSETARLRSVGEIGTILDMNILMSKSLEIIAPLGSPQQHSTGQPMYNQSGIFFAPDFPDFLLPLDHPAYKTAPGVVNRAITWGNVRKEPGTMSGKPFRGTQEIKPRIREFIAIYGDYGKRWIVENNLSQLEGFGELASFVEVSAQAFDNLVQYNIWARSNYEVEELTEWFEDYMDTYRGMFLEAGIVQLVFDRRVRDDTLVQMKNSYHVRSVLYYVRTERVRIRSIRPIKRIDLKINVNDLGRVRDTLSDHIIDTNLYNRILKQWHQ